MIQIEKTLVSDELLEAHFTCDLNACKGGCCVQGEAGAPLEEDELAILDEIYPKVKEFLRPEGINAISKQGAFVKGSDGEWETPLVNNKECAYVIFDPGGVAKCGIEKAFQEEKISWQKPISCHLYPVRVKEYTELIAVNYHKWHLCNAACDLGQKLKTPLYKFVKDALIRKFGEAWYQDLEEAAKS
ncbi:DUF3109 family protein [uncultured Eudoraea sp.]|uniref:DUF3109 family protein n=1 Tax=uncultured Eudoraea sp. TaxID=1035614 RepID=UPI00260A0F7B|nr:DUF3109 family protein [uncultured Eudoraea sp.]